MEKARTNSIPNSGYILLENAAFLPEVIKYAHEGHQVTIPLKGNSMRPYLEDGRDKAVLTILERECMVGDAVLAVLPHNRYVLHRIAKIDGDKVQLLGDGNLTYDPTITKDNVKLIAVAFIRKGRNKWEYTNSRYYKTYAAVWLKLYPIRRWLLAIWRRLPVWVRDRVI